MHKHPTREITNEEAYAQLYTALLSLRKQHGTDFFAGPNFAETTLETARVTLTALQMALVAKMDESPKR